MDPQLAAVQKKLGVVLRRHREAAGLTQEQVAEKAGIQPRHVQRLEAGGSNPRLWTLLRLAEAMGVDLAEIVGEVAGGAAG